MSIALPISSYLSLSFPQHTKIVYFYGGGFFSNGTRFLVEEFMANGSLEGILASSLALTYTQKLQVMHHIQSPALHDIYIYVCIHAWFQISTRLVRASIP